MLSSPLMATSAVVLGLALLAVPLHRLTNSLPPSTAPVARISPPQSTEAGEAAVIRVRLLRAAALLVVTTADGRELWKAENLPAGESEIDARLVLDNNHLELSIDITPEPGAGETAAFFTVLPDGREERKNHVIGEARLQDQLSFDWPPHASPSTP